MEKMKEHCPKISSADEYIGKFRIRFKAAVLDLNKFAKDGLF